MDSDIAARYRAHANAFEQKVAATGPDQWDNQSPCADWTARDVVGHIVVMHAAMLQPVGRSLSPAPSVEQNPLAAFTAARADVELCCPTRTSETGRSQLRADR